ncbi:hypothetical protein [Pseudomonas sp. NFR16]|uniref:hypothetical protein n=1 Tax=Pseudomonas sp. NFR16 TaxID=1566248 RepID=UPI0011604C08|nr:hypothetical protein [Pseudomonas sp. NFR16]
MSSIPKNLQRLLLITLIILSYTHAFASCGKNAVLGFFEDGETIADIADKCEMDEADVKSIVSKKTPSPPDTKLPPGTPLEGCGCWGFVTPGATQAMPACSKGYAHASACGAMCPTGGFAWQRICN